MKQINKSLNPKKNLLDNLHGKAFKATFAKNPIFHN